MLDGADRIIDRCDPRGRTLNEALREDQAQRAVHWKRAARRVSLPFEAFLIAAAILGYGSGIALFYYLFNASESVPLSSWLINGLCGVAFFNLCVAPRLWEFLLQPIYKRRLDRVIGDAKAEGVELGSPDRQSVLI